MFKVNSNVFLTVRDREGMVLRRVAAKNLVVNAGLSLITDWIGGLGFRADTIQVGTGTASTTATMTALGASVATKTIERRVKTGYSMSLQALLLTTEGNGSTLAEIGTFKGSTMIARALISPTIAKTDLISVTLEHIFTVSAS